MAKIKRFTVDIENMEDEDNGFFSAAIHNVSLTVITFVNDALIASTSVSMLLFLILGIAGVIIAFFGDIIDAAKKFIDNGMKFISKFSNILKNFIPVAPKLAKWAWAVFKWVTGKIWKFTKYLFSGDFSKDAGKFIKGLKDNKIINGIKNFFSDIKKSFVGTVEEITKIAKTEFKKAFPNIYKTLSKFSKSNFVTKVKIGYWWAKAAINEIADLPKTIAKFAATKINQVKNSIINGMKTTVKYFANELAFKAFNVKLFAINMKNIIMANKYGNSIATKIMNIFSKSKTYLSTVGTNIERAGSEAITKAVTALAKTGEEFKIAAQALAKGSNLLIDVATAASYIDIYNPDKEEADFQKTGIRSSLESSRRETWDFKLNPFTNKGSGYRINLDFAPVRNALIHQNEYNISERSALALGYAESIATGGFILLMAAGPIGFVAGAIGIALLPSVFKGIAKITGMAQGKKSTEQIQKEQQLTDLYVFGLRMEGIYKPEILAYNKGSMGVYVDPNSNKNWYENDDNFANIVGYKKDKSGEWGFDDSKISRRMGMYQMELFGMLQFITYDNNGEILAETPKVDYVEVDKNNYPGVPNPRFILSEYLRTKTFKHNIWIKKVQAEYQKRYDQNAKYIEIKRQQLQAEQDAMNEQENSKQWYYRVVNAFDTRPKVVTPGKYIPISSPIVDTNYTNNDSRFDTFRSTTINMQTGYGLWGK